jgi:predicted Zn-dependent peptidase
MLSKISRSLTQAQKVSSNRNLTNPIITQRSLFQAARNFSNDTKGLRTQATQDSGVQTKEQFMQFSKEPIMRNFGELPFGEIPEPLKYVRPFNSTTLSNGIRVCSEKIPGATANIGVYVGAGSRNEDLTTSGTSYLLQKMALRGTTNKSKTELAEAIENMGARYSAHSDREFTSYNLQVLKGDTSGAVNILGDMLCNNALNSGELELVKDEVSMEHEDNHNRYVETTLENAHFNSFREHMLGQPIKGDRDLTSQLGVDHLRDYHTANYFGDNVVVVATGDVSHDQVVEAVQ